MEIERIFGRDSRVIAIPSWRRSRLWFSNGSALDRWRLCGLYPGYSLGGRIVRRWLRLLAYAGMFPARPVASKTPYWLGVGGLTPANVGGVAVLHSAGGGYEKWVLQIRGPNGNVVAYGKLANGAKARALIARERAALMNVPVGLSPKVLDLAEAYGCSLLLMSPLPGRAPPTDLPLDPSAWRLMRRMQRPDAGVFEIASHPWWQARMRKHATVSAWASVLAGRHWPVWINHGDFTPWNVCVHDGEWRLLDWEFAAVDGFPLLDVVHYVLQVACLVKHWSPHLARDRARAWIGSNPLLPIHVDEADVLVRVCAWDAQQRDRSLGERDSSAIQQWREQVWR